MKAGNLWNIFCQVIDNYGDIGVCWRLAVGLAAHGERVRLWVDDASALDWMAPAGAPNVEVRRWAQPLETGGLEIGDILVETFGCEIAPEFIASYALHTRATGQKPLWINLEYLSAETYASRNHGLPSPVLNGSGTGMTKYFFYPGFTVGTGGLLREADLAERQARFDRPTWLRQLGIGFKGERLVCLFCYEPPALGSLLEQLASDAKPTRLLVTHGRATASVQALVTSKNQRQPGWNGRDQLSISYLPALSQNDFDHLLWACDLNFVRGEDSLVRAIWANKPFVWQIYPQHDDAHHRKLEAFLNLLNAPPSLRSFHLVWNGMLAQGLPSLCLEEWQFSVTKFGEIQRSQSDLVARLMGFRSKNH